MCRLLFYRNARQKEFFFHQHLFFLAPSLSEASFITPSIPPFLSPFQFLSLRYPFTHSLSLSPSHSLCPSLFFSLSFSLSANAIRFSTSHLIHLTSKDVNERAKAESLLSSTAAAQAAGQIRRLSGMKRKLPTIHISYSILSTLRF